VDRKTCFKAIFLGIVAVCVLASSCKDAPTVWKAEVRSPDGLWIASVRTIQNGGFGSARIDTVVYLKQSRGSQPPVEVLAFDCLGPAPRRPYVMDSAKAGGTIDLTMKWVTPSHLHVTYDRHPDLYFQTVKYDGISISVQDLSSEPTNSKDSK
jgi:hypothetical protein